MSAEDIANAFITHYYTTLNSNPAALAGLYVSGTDPVFTALQRRYIFLQLLNPQLFNISFLLQYFIATSICSHF
jgi:hypothetical protein